MKMGPLTFPTLALLALTALASLSWDVEAICCPWTLTADVKCQCDDGENVHPWECCSTGACNIFCCNCGGPCRSNSTTPTRDLLEDLFQSDSGPRSLLHPETLNSAAHFYKIDANSDNRLSVEEAMNFISKNRNLLGRDVVRMRRSAGDWFSNMDSDGDGHISTEEFDGPHLTKDAIQWIAKYDV